MTKINMPFDDQTLSKLSAGEMVLISGVIYTARDAAHKRIYNDLQNNKKPVFDFYEQTLYYAGPTPKRPDGSIGACGPTTSTRVDIYTPTLLDYGLKGMIGKGNRNHCVIESIIKNKAVYFAAIGGAGALIAKTIKHSRVIAYADLGAEAVHELVISDFPCVVAIDCMGNNIYKSYTH